MTHPVESLRAPALGCRCCHYYAPEGRRGGQCKKLGAPVRGSWAACSLIVPSFTPAYRERLGKVIPLRRIISMTKPYSAVASEAVVVSAR
jgi:hypothetical protein